MPGTGSLGRRTLENRVGSDLGPLVTFAIFIRCVALKLGEKAFSVLVSVPQLSALLLHRKEKGEAGKCGRRKVRREIKLLGFNLS